MAEQNKKKNPTNVRICTYITKRRYEELVAVADEMGISLSALVKVSIEKYIKSKMRKNEATLKG